VIVVATHTNFRRRLTAPAACVVLEPGSTVDSRVARSERTGRRRNATRRGGRRAAPRSAPPDRL